MTNSKIMRFATDQPARTAAGEARFEALLGEFAPIYREHRAFANRRSTWAAQMSARQCGQHLSPADIDAARQALRSAFPSVTMAQALAARDALRAAFYSPFYSPLRGASGDERR
jgi:hypothetical protein